MPSKERFRTRPSGRAFQRRLLSRNFPFRERQQPKLRELFCIYLILVVLFTNAERMAVPAEDAKPRIGGYNLITQKKESGVTPEEAGRTARPGAISFLTRIGLAERLRIAMKLSLFSALKTAPMVWRRRCGAKKNPTFVVCNSSFEHVCNMWDGPDCWRRPVKACRSQSQLGSRERITTVQGLC